MNELHATSMLLFIYDNEEVFATDFKQISGHYDGLKRLAESLEKVKLVDIEVEEYPRITFRYKLTSKGKEVAQKLLEIEKIMGG